MTQATGRTRGRYRLDVVARDKDEQPVLVVEVKARHGISGAEGQLQHYMEIGHFPYGMVVTLEEIGIYQRQSENWPSPVLTLSTADMLSSYEPNIHEKQIFGFYLSTLVAAWLDDLMFNWQSPEPPGIQELESIGLLPRLAGGSTEIEAVWP